MRPYANPALYQIDVPALSYMYAAYGKSGLINNFLISNFHWSWWLEKQFRLIYQAVNKRNSLDVLLQLIIICLIVV